MVLPIIIGIAVIALVVLFRDQIKAFADRSLKEKTPEEVQRETVITERGAFQNTQAFLLGEKGLADLTAQSEANKLLIEKFLSDSQMNIDQALTGVNETLVEAQKNLANFADESKATIVTNVTQFQKDVDKNIMGIGSGLEGIKSGIFQFGVDTRINLQNLFGGQATPKAIATSITPTQKITTKSGGTIDLSFIQGVEPISGQGSKIEEEELEVKAITSRTGRATRFN